MDDSSQNDQLWPSSINFADLVRSLDQPRKLGRGLVSRDPTGNMTEQILSILETHTGSPKPSTESKLKVMNANPRQIRTIACLDPTGFEHPVDWFSSKRKNMRLMSAPSGFHNRGRDRGSACRCAKFRHA